MGLIGIQFLRYTFSAGPLFKFTTYGDRHIIVSVVSKKFENKIVQLMELPWLNCNLVMV